MKRRKLEIAALAVAALVLGLSIAQAVREGSVGPIWAIAWLPAVLAGGFARTSTGKRCSLRRR